MLKHLGYSGTYNDENISVSILLENPIEHPLQPILLTFSVRVQIKSNHPNILRPENIAFYILDESNDLHNTKKLPYLIDIPDDDEPVCKPDYLICAAFKHDYIFQDLRIAFYYRPYEKINIINLKH